MRWKIALLVAAVASVACGLSLNSRLKVGDSLEARIESPHPIRGGMWSQEVVLPGATFLKFHVDTLDLGPEGLFLLHDGEGALVFSHLGPLDARWLPSVEGERAVLEVWPGEGSMPWGLVVDGLARGTEQIRAESGHVDPESICGSNDSRDPACYGPSLRSGGDAVGTRNWIPQHPGGSPKRFAVASDLDAGGNATIQAVGLKGNAKNTDVGYFADTEGGPSFRFVVTGTHFTPSTTVAINGAAWTSVAYKSSTKLVIKGGAALKSEVPKNTPATFTFANPGIPPTSLVWQWP